MSSLQDNAFSYKSPENMTAQEVLDLFVPFSDSLSIQDTGHIFIHGHRGCGKSMIFRYLSPDCQSLLLKKPIKDLPYYGVYLSVKATDLNIGELNRLQNQISGHILSEHFLVVYLVVKTLQSIEENLSNIIDEKELLEELKAFCTGELFDRLKMAGWEDCPDLSAIPTAKDTLKSVVNVFDKIHATTIQYLRKLLYTSQIVPFIGV